MIKTLLRRVLYSLVLQSVEAFIALLTVLVGLPVLLSPQKLAPESVQEIMPHWLLLMWAWGLVLGGLFTLVGIINSQYRFERIGVAILWGTSTVYGIALTTLLPSSLVALGTYIAFSLSMAARYWVIGRLIKLNVQIFGLRERAAELEERLREE